ncbi:hypothetical protein L1887_30244 [Cichorium endivia]|nr:hypothetical protein L1887_30244 [Cichorium endivia]
MVSFLSRSSVVAYLSLCREQAVTGSTFRGQDGDRRASNEVRRLLLKSASVSEVDPVIPYYALVIAHVPFE